MSVNLFAFIQKGARTIKVAFQGYSNALLKLIEN